MIYRIGVLTLVLLGMLVADAFCDGMPDGWSTYEKYAGTYEMGGDKNVYKSRPQSYYIKSLKTGLTGNDYGVLSQAISTEKYKGKRIRFSALTLQRHLDISPKNSGRLEAPSGAASL